MHFFRGYLNVYVNKIIALILRDLHDKNDECSGRREYLTVINSILDQLFACTNHFELQLLQTQDFKQIQNKNSNQPSKFHK